ncbi:MAG TPA: DUF5829 family protein [Blastocatellia bacterium]|nr:DUF5829 family protein [Blastocatellia bacterium]
MRQRINRAALLLLTVAMVCAAMAQTAKPTSARASGATMDRVYLNHFFLTLDGESYQAMQASPFLRDEFAPFEQRTTVRQDTTYTGIYFYGAHTYFEFFGAGSDGIGRIVGASGVAFGVEAAGASRRLKTRLEAALGVPVAFRPITRRTGDRDVDWFYMTDPPLPSPLLQSWVMEYREHFLDEWFGELKPATRGITRAEILERYVAKLGEQDRRAQKLLEDVIEITFAFPAAERVLFLKMCEAFGYRVSGKPWCKGPGITFVFVTPKDGVRGITSVKFSLRHRKSGQARYQFGKTTLQFNADRTALWTFQ